MIRTKLFLASALALTVTFAGASATAQEPANQITYFTFSAPFELPGGKVLPAGKYVFKIVDSPSNRHIVQIMSADSKTMHATLLAIPAQRQEPPSEPEVRFMETAANTPPAVRTWWYPGRSIGHEFIYPKEQARRLAARQSEPVLTVASEATTTEQMQTADLSRVNASGQETAAQVRADAAARTATSAQSTRPATRADSSLQSTPTESTTPTATTAPATRTRAESRTALPATASLLPLVGLIGLGSLLGAGLLRSRR